VAKIKKWTMKNPTQYLRLLITFLLVLGVDQNLYSQQYKPMVVEGNRWRVIMRYATTIPPYLEIHEYYVQGDTIISGKIYKKVYQRELEAVNNDYMVPYKQKGNSYLTICLREDTLEKRVYCYPLAEIIQGCPVESEFILNDFSLQVGDTIPPNCDFNAVVDTISDISFQHLSSWISPTDSVKVFQSGEGHLIYESIGSISKGIFYGFWIPFRLENFCRGSEKDCGILTTSLIKNQNSFFWDIAPNPAKNECIIKLNYALSEIQNLDLKITDTTGKIIKSIPLSKMVRLDLTELQNGIYFLELSHQKKGKEIKKLVVL
jgi:hypothetical protein